MTAKDKWQLIFEDIIHQTYGTNKINCLERIDSKQLETIQELIRVELLTRDLEQPILGEQ